MNFRSPWVVFVMGIGFLLIVFSNVGVPAGTVNIDFLVGGIVIVIASAAYLFSKRRR